jgi:galactoside 2-L-fucosyltransferase 1/2
MDRSSGNNQSTEVRRIQFIVATDDIDWVRSNLRLSSVAADIASRSSTWSQFTSAVGTKIDVDLSYSVGHQPGFDLLMLSMCDAVVMTTGSFGWWSAWLGNKTTIYYRGWPRKDSPLERTIDRRNYYRPSWIGIDGPHVRL